MIGSRSAAAGRTLAIAERALFALAAVLLGWYLLQHAITAYEQAAANRELESVHLAVATPAARHARPAVGALVGRVDIRRVGVSAIVREGDDTATLQHAVGHIPDTALPGEPGNAGLAGHRHTFFPGPRDGRARDPVAVTPPAGGVGY